MKMNNRQKLLKVAVISRIKPKLNQIKLKVVIDSSNPVLSSSKMPTSTKLHHRTSVQTKGNKGFKIKSQKKDEQTKRLKD